MIRQRRRQGDYSDREIDCQEAMKPGFQAIVDCMLEAGRTRGEIMRSPRRLIALGHMRRRSGRRIRPRRIEAYLLFAGCAAAASWPSNWRSSPSVRAAIPRKSGNDLSKVLRVKTQSAGGRQWPDGVEGGPSLDFP
jgi:hypothetical protein